MKFSTATVASFAVLIPSVSAHLRMTNPTQWFVAEKAGPSVELSQGQQNPLLADGSNFPCPGVPPAAPVASYAPGSPQTLQIVGSAVHGGGSGQMSITYDTKPTKSSKFRVMTSWMGDHPVKAVGNLPANADNPLPPLTFTVPKGLPAGTAVVAWTWFNRVGNREMYMKCATVTIGGSETSKAAFEALPEMFRANSGNGCKVDEGIQAIAFKNPGPQTFGVGITPVPCDNTMPGTGTGTGGPVTPPAKSSAPATPVTPPVKSSAPAKPVTPPVRSSPPAKPVTPVTPPAKSAVPPAKPVTPVTPPVKSAVPPAKPVTPVTPPVKSAVPPAKPVTPVTPPAAPASGRCVEGQVTCNAGRTWSLCGSGVNKNMGPVAPGMTCTNGQFSKRTIRFSPSHRRRRTSA